MNPTDLIARLRGEYRIPIMDGLGPAGGEEPDNPTEFVRRFEAPPIQHEAADALTDSQERIEALEDALRNVVKSGSHQQARMIARASLPFAVAYRHPHQHLTAHPGQPIVSVPSTPAT